jgi:hypothetical protein
MAKDAKRIFSDTELLDAGRLTTELIAEHLERGLRSEAGDLVRRFQTELMTMFFSYTGWERSILECMAELDGQARSDAALVAIENWDIAPERQVQTQGVARRWNEEVDAIAALIEEGSDAPACRRAAALRVEALALHDGLMSRVSALLTILYEDHSEKELTWVLNRVMRPEAMDPDGKLPFREKVENIMRFTRSHLLPFSVSEDDEKVTFMPDPCPSGARLIRSGHYDSPRNNAIVRDRGPMTYGRESLPIYCCHEPAMELSSVLKTGIPLFIVDPPEDVGITPCKIYVYKNPAQIPEAYYQRLGLKRPEDLIAVSD